MHLPLSHIGLLNSFYLWIKLKTYSKFNNFKGEAGTASELYDFELG